MVDGWTGGWGLSAWMEHEGARGGRAGPACRTQRVLDARAWVDRW